jgi:endo-1,4-beta-D-glucanase Y
VRLWLALALGLTLAMTVLGEGARAGEADDWARYKARFITPDGRLFDDSAEDVSHSEGQGYALVLAAFHDDRETFRKLWVWTMKNLEIRGDGLAAWRWRPADNPHVLDHNNATDGDLLIAWGLAEAGRRWGEKDYTAQARRIAFALHAKAVFASAYGPALRPGVAGFGDEDSEDGPLVNLSYWVFPALDALAEASPELDWRAVERTGLALFDAAKFGPLALPSDWISLHGDVAPAPMRAPLFGYELVRAPLYLAWGPPEARPRLAALMQSWLGGTAGAPGVIDVERGVMTQGFAAPGYRAVAALARCAVSGEKFPDELRSVGVEDYYSATLHMLSLTLLNLKYGSC